MAIEQQHNGDILERTSALEAWKKGVDKSLDSIFGSLQHIESLLSDSRATNWGNILSAIGLAILSVGLVLGIAGAFWAAEIRPLNSSGETLAKAVLVAADKMEALHDADWQQKMNLQKAEADTHEFAALTAYRLQQLEAKKQ